MKKSILKIFLVSILLSPLSGCAYDDTPIVGFVFDEAPAFPSEVKVLDQLHITFDVIHPRSVEKITYSVFDSAEARPNIEFKLYKEGNSENIIDEELVKGENYILEASYAGYTATQPFTPDEKVELLKRENLKYTYKYADPDASTPNGDVKMLVIPINLHGSWLDDWDSSYFSIMDDLYFGEERELSLRSYYEDASNGSIHVSGMISELFDFSTYTSNDIQGNYEYLIEMINTALETIETNHPEIDWTEYDLDGNGAIDNLHLVTNFDPYLYESQTGQSAWSTNLWPHMSNLYNDPTTPETPVARVYSAGVLNHLINDYTGDSAITPIHEQGHIFGLPDYYDYDGKVDYIGGYDMQSSNVFDWNPYSKLSVGWTDAYIVKDSCVITTDAASLGGKCIIIPADPETYNYSAFDEYFMIELFSNYGNNAKFQEYYNQIFGTAKEKYGVRLYHVDARFFDYSGREVKNPRYGFQAITNSSYTYTKNAYRGYKGLQDLADYKFISIIQKEGKDTFGDTNASSRKYLNRRDLFMEGDEFTFDKYSHFLTKRDNLVETMDNGEKFPYKIEFVKMSKDKVTVKVTKIPLNNENQGK